MISTVNHYSAYNYFSPGTYTRYSRGRQTCPMVRGPRPARRDTYFAAMGLLCWRSDSVYANLRSHVKLTLSAYHFCWRLARNHGRLAFVGFDTDRLSRAWSNTVGLSTQQCQLRRDAYPRLNVDWHHRASTYGQAATLGHQPKSVGSNCGRGGPRDRAGRQLYQLNSSSNPGAKLYADRRDRSEGRARRATPASGMALTLAHGASKARSSVLWAGIAGSGFVSNPGADFRHWVNGYNRRWRHHLLVDELKSFGLAWSEAGGMISGLGVSQRTQRSDFDACRIRKLNSLGPTRPQPKLLRGQGRSRSGHRIELSTHVPDVASVARRAMAVPGPRHGPGLSKYEPGSAVEGAPRNGRLRAPNALWVLRQSLHRSSSQAPSGYTQTQTQNPSRPPRGYVGVGTTITHQTPKKGDCQGVGYASGLAREAAFEYGRFAVNPNLTQVDLIVFANPAATPGLIKQARQLGIPTLGLDPALRSRADKRRRTGNPGLSFGILGNPNNGWLSFNLGFDLLKLSSKA